jgi:1-acyl-sn-glycerol-3-phosphate acyltransferase
MLPGFVEACRPIVKGAILLLFRCRVKGMENVPKHGPLLIVANHIQLVDPILIGVLLSRKVSFMAKEELFRSKFSRFFMRNFGAFPVRRGRADKTAFSQANKILAKGRALVMFPEGKRSKDLRLQPAFVGSAMIASRSGAPILPIGVSGTEEINGISWIWRRPQVVINIGRPFSLPAVKGRLTKEKRVELTYSIMNQIAKLLPTEYQGHYAELSGEISGIDD